MAEFRTSALTPREQFTRRLANDARSIAWAARRAARDNDRTCNEVAADCGLRLVQAWDLGDPELTAQAEQQLREAVALLGGGR